ncbi:MAG: branched-chain amino acid ABC transporter permease [Burkholderiaceae bacterium]
MSNFLQAVASGVLTGLLYGLVALSFVVIYRAARIINLAQGEVLVVGAFTIWTMTVAAGLPTLLGSGLALLLAALIGLAVERLVFRPLIGRPMTVIVLASVALIVVLRGATQIVFGPQSRPFPQVLPAGAFDLGLLHLNIALTIGAVLTLLLTEALHRFFRNTLAGLRLSAVAEDHLTALSMGISVRRSSAIAWALGAALSALAAMIYLSGAPLDVSVASIGLRALPVALLGGLESIRGATLAGVLVGIGESLAAAYLDRYTSGTMSQVFPFLVMILIMLVRPQGLFGWKVIERV